MTADERFVSERFPRSSKYHPQWVIASASGGANALWLTEWLADALDLRSNMRVLDLGCGLAMSSVFLRREFGVQVWATEADRGSYLGYVRLVGRRRAEARLDEPIVSIPGEYA